MRKPRRTPVSRIRGLLVLLVLAGIAHPSGGHAQVYKCTDAAGRTAFSDKPCATPPGAAVNATGSGNSVKQEVLQQPQARAAGAANSIATGTDATSAMCARHQGSQATDATIQALPEKQREAVTAVLRGVISALARDPGAQESLKRVTLHMDGARNAVICVPRPRMQAPGATPVTTYVAHKIEPNGRTEIQQPGAAPIVSNDANEPQTVAARCAGLITSCVRATRGNSLDTCFEQQPVCPAGRLDPAAACCPQACKDAYRRERAKGTEADNATIKVIFGDDAGTASCIPGMPRKG